MRLTLCRNATRYLGRVLVPWLQRVLQVRAQALGELPPADRARWDRLAAWDGSRAQASAIHRESMGGPPCASAYYASEALRKIVDPNASV